MGKKAKTYLPAGARFTQKEDWTHVTKKGPKKDRLLLVWRESETYNLCLEIHFRKIPADWLWELKSLEDRYLEEEVQAGNQGNLTRLLILVASAVSGEPLTEKLRYGARDWEADDVAGLWKGFKVPANRVNRNKIGLVVCTGIRPPVEKAS